MTATIAPADSPNRIKQIEQTESNRQTSQLVKTAVGDSSLSRWLSYVV
ncbi:MAG: hypothetical protein J07HN4v3_00419 [Halonotius sp. J07HN4]|nr:MAG: hypothetical protein J07HN4v3_00419 [Halonotius sp. J07HN4]